MCLVRRYTAARGEFNNVGGIFLLVFECFFIGFSHWHLRNRPSLHHQVSTQPEVQFIESFAG